MTLTDMCVYGAQVDNFMGLQYMRVWAIKSSPENRPYPINAAAAVDIESDADTVSSSQNPCDRIWLVPRISDSPKLSIVIVLFPPVRDRT